MARVEYDRMEDVEPNFVGPIVSSYIRNDDAVAVNCEEQSDGNWTIIAYVDD